MQYFRVSILRGKPGVRWGVSVLSAFDRQVAFYFMGLIYEANFAWQAHGCLACIFHGTCRTFDVFLEVFQFWGLRLHGVRRIWMYLATFQLSLAQPSVTFASLCVCVSYRWLCSKKFIFNLLLKLRVRALALQRSEMKILKNSRGLEKYNPRF